MPKPINLAYEQYVAEEARYGRMPRMSSEDFENMYATSGGERDRTPTWNELPQWDGLTYSKEGPMVGPPLPPEPNPGGVPRFYADADVERMREAARNLIRQRRMRESVAGR